MSRASSLNINALDIDFSILPSSPDPLIYVVFRCLKIMRLFKLTRHFKTSQVLTETFQKVRRRSGLVRSGLSISLSSLDNDVYGILSLYLYTGGVLFHVEWCTRKP